MCHGGSFLFALVHLWGVFGTYLHESAYVAEHVLSISCGGICCGGALSSLGVVETPNPMMATPDRSEGARYVRSELHDRSSVQV